MKKPGAVKEPSGPQWKFYKNVQLHALLDHPTNLKLLELLKIASADSISAYLRNLIKEEAARKGIE